MKTLTISTSIIVMFMVLQASAGELPARILDSRPSGAPALSIPAFAKIYAALEKKGAVRVIVRLAAPENMASGFALEGALSSAESVTSQRADIAQIQGKVASKLSKGHGGAAKRFEFIPFMAMEVDPAEFNALAASSDIVLIEEDIPVPPTLIQSVPLIGGINGSFNGYTGNGQTVAILDTGVDKTHPFLSGKVVSEACYSTTDATDGAVAVCTSGSTLPGQGVNCSSAVPGCDHGTHLAGIIAGINATFSGVARDANLISIQIFSQFPASSPYCGTGALNPCVLSYTSDQILGLERVYSLRNTYNIASVNMSLGGGSYAENCDTDADYTAEKTAIDTLRSVGIATVIASGNDGSTNAISAPACISTAISVGATDKSDIVASYSNSASMLSLLAPGSSIYSSTPAGTYGYKFGTSMATPHVAAAWAVLKSARPTATVAEVLNALTSTGKSVSDARNGIVKPRIQLTPAVNAIFNGPVSGVCGDANNGFFSIAPTINLCSVGTASAVSGSVPWTWTCTGINGGAIANCLANTSSQKVSLIAEGFDSVIPPAFPAGWSSIGTLGKWQMSSGTVHPSGTAAHSPSNLVYFNSWTVDNGVTAYLASPVFSLIGKVGGKVGFWMYQDSQYTNTDRVDIYVNTVSNLIGASLIGAVNRYNPVAGWYEYTFDIPSTFTGATNYLLINGASDFGNDIHLDDISVTALIPTYPLTFSFAGSGYGSVNSVPSGINCAGTTGSACPPQSFNGGLSVTLSASADYSSTNCSTFTGWSTNTTVCPVTGTCSVTMTGPVNITGTFVRDKLVNFSPQTSGTYGSLLEAFTAAAPTGQIIQVRDNSGLTPFPDPLTINKSITFKGGYATGFTTNAGYTTTNGKLTVASGGVLKVQRIKIR
jgi:subtilisin family serine protease